MTHVATESTPEAPDGGPPAAPPAVVVRAPPGDPAPGWVVAGVPVLERLVRQLARAGVRQVWLEGFSPEEARRWASRLERTLPRLSLRLLGAGDDDAPTTTAGPAVLAANGIYDEGDLAAWLRAPDAQAAPTPRFALRGPADRCAAERWLWASIRKSLSHDGPVAYLLARPLAHPITRAMARLGVRPNAVTAVGLAVGIAAGWVAALGGYGAGVAAAALFFVGLILDCVDGDLARITGATSRLGQWLDTITDDLSYVALAVGLGVGLSRETGDATWLALGLATAALVIVGQGIIYHALWRGGGPIDTARYPWFFMGQEGLAQEEGRSALGWLSFAVRRDALTLYFVGLALLGWRGAILGLLAAGAVAYAVLLTIDLVLRARRRDPAGGVR